MKEHSADTQDRLEKVDKKLDEIIEKIDSKCTTKDQKIKGSHQQDQTDKTCPKETINESLGKSIS